MELELWMVESHHVGAKDTCAHSGLEERKKVEHDPLVNKSSPSKVFRRKEASSWRICFA